MFWDASQAYGRFYDIPPLKPSHLSSSSERPLRCCRQGCSPGWFQRSHECHIVNHDYDDNHYYYNDYFFITEYEPFFSFYWWKLRRCQLVGQQRCRKYFSSLAQSLVP